MSAPEPSSSDVDAALIAYVGRGRTGVPTAAPDAVRTLGARNPDALRAEVEATLRIADSIPFDDVAPFDDGLRGRLYQRLRDLFPERGDDAIEALGGRWAYLTLR
ncbi:hypothetical protein LQ938_13900 [Microbacterium sp. cx-55]|uniref:hypothetical protein n=1 Tax=Microbacterium sp. cx-55 TaxID=2875948 RepID=UPI001CC0A97C|nr:hypothetical protein [Microbacterium sp. cx-55]MBZ4488284.1 hypothetical protein [Microbacterium sp. cx-55]UGB34945.1 hypothetical protein LQ938_13900 [Microbacterium sp. cx-55]